MKEKHYFILKYRGGDVFDKMLETRDTGKAIKSAIDEWNNLTWREQKTTRVELVEAYTLEDDELEDDEQELDFSAYEPIWSSSEMYFVDADYNPNGGPYVGFSTLEEAERARDNGASYSQRNMVIYAPEGVYTRKWWNTTQGVEDCNDPIKFGNFGFYGDWELQEYSGATFDSYADLIKNFSF